MKFLFLFKQTNSHRMIHLTCLRNEHAERLTQTHPIPLYPTSHLILSYHSLNRIRNTVTLNSPVVHCMEPRRDTNFTIIRTYNSHAHPPIPLNFSSTREGVEGNVCHLQDACYEQACSETGGDKLSAGLPDSHQNNVLIINLLSLETKRLPHGPQQNIQPSDPRAPVGKREEPSCVYTQPDWLMPQWQSHRFNGRGHHTHLQQEILETRYVGSVDDVTVSRILFMTQKLKNT